eukprot:6173483-Pleurochrysis_carterae.AAC.1
MMKVIDPIKGRAAQESARRTERLTNRSQKAMTHNSVYKSEVNTEINTRPVGLALYGRLNRKSVGSPEAVPLGSAPPTSGI